MCMVQGLIRGFNGYEVNWMKEKAHLASVEKRGCET